MLSLLKLVGLDIVFIKSQRMKTTDLILSVLRLLLCFIVDFFSL